MYMVEEAKANEKTASMKVHNSVYVYVYMLLI